MFGNFILTQLPMPWKIYQFFKADPGGDGKNTGEYILLKDIKTINGIKFPKERAWYYNKDDGYLGTDILN